MGSLKPPSHLKPYAEGSLTPQHTARSRGTPQVLSEDYSKAVFLCADRSLAFHAKFGAYYRTRIPKFGRDLAYHPYNADLLVAASSNEIYRQAQEAAGLYSTAQGCRAGV